MTGEACWPGSYPRLQGDEPGIRRPEPARAEVERAEVIVEVDVQPLAPGLARSRRGQGDKPSPGSPPLHPRSDQGVQDERVHGAIPGDVDEADQVIVFPGAHPAQAVPVHLCPPVIVCHDPMAEALGMQRVERLVAETPAPLVSDHPATVRRNARRCDPFSRHPEGQTGENRGNLPSIFRRERNIVRLA